MAGPHEQWLSKAGELVDLWRLCEGIEKELAPMSDKFKIVDEYYIPARYPDALPGSLFGAEPSEDNAQEALDAATEVYAIMTYHLGSK